MIECQSYFWTTICVLAFSVGLVLSAGPHRRSEVRAAPTSEAERKIVAEEAANIRNDLKQEVEPRGPRAADLTCFDHNSSKSTNLN